MAILSGCQEGKATPKLIEVKCPVCGEIMEVFTRLGGGVGETGRTVSDEKCDKCGNVIPSGTPDEELCRA